MQNHARFDAGLFAASRAPLSTPLLREMTRLADAAILFAVAWAGLTFAGNHLLSASVGTALPYFALALAAAIGLRAADSYHHVKSRSAVEHVLRVMLASGIALLVAAIPVISLAAPGSAATLGWTGLALWLSTTAFHAHYKALLGFLQRSGRLSETVVIVGATPNALRLIERNAETRELNIVGIFDDRLERAPKSLGGVPLLGRLDDLMAWDALPRIDRIVVTVTSEARGRVRMLIDRLRYLPNRVILLLDLEGFDPETETLAQIADAPAAFVSGAPQDVRRALVKRASDLVLASLLVVIFAPVMLGCAIAIRLDGPGPIFFRQKRHGFNNEIISVWKFRSMQHDPAAANRMTAQTTANDPRVTRVGRILRATSLDELPQLFNVIMGGMSLVGPRPHAIGMTAETTEVHDIVSDYAHRHRVKPGLTGWAQINGSRGPVHAREEVRERVRLDLEYINRSSLWLDLYILAMTAPCLLGDAKRQR